jgi:hypothetical protein
MVKAYLKLRTKLLRSHVKKENYKIAHMLITIAIINVS